MNIVVTYSGGINKVLDKKLTEAMESVGLIWLAQGIDTFSGERDIVFVVKEKWCKEKHK